MMCSTKYPPSDASDDTEASGFKSDNNGSDASDDEETPRKKSKANTTAKSSKSNDKDLVKVKREEVENGIFDDGSYKDPFVEDDGAQMVDYA